MQLPGEGKAGQIRRVGAEQQGKDIHHAQAGAVAGQCRRQHPVAGQVGGPHEQGIQSKAAQMDPAQVLEGVDEAPAEDQAVQLEGVVEDAADRQAEPLDGGAQRNDHRQQHGQHHREGQVIEGLVPDIGHARQAEGDKQHCHHPHVEKPVHDDGGQGKAHAVFHFAAGEPGPEQVPHMEGQQKVKPVAGGHAPEHHAPQRPLVDADELFPPQQPEQMPHHQQRHRDQQQYPGHAFSAAKPAAFSGRSARAYSAGVPKGRCRSVAKPWTRRPRAASTL